MFVIFSGRRITHARTHANTHDNDDEDDDDDGDDDDNALIEWNTWVELDVLGAFNYLLLACTSRAKFISYVHM